MSTPSTDDYAPSAQFYDYVPFYRDRADVAFYVEEAVNANGPVLEVACGSGRVLLPTARAGISIVGLDASSEMLTRCRSSLRHQPTEVQERVTLFNADMRAFDLQRQFALVTLPFRAFQHLLTVNDQIASLKCVLRHMRADGRFIVDLFNPWLEVLVNRPLNEEFDTDPPFTLPDGRTVQRRAKIIERHPFTQVADNEFIYYVTDAEGAIERIVHPFSMRHTFKFEMEHLLYRVGFAVEQVYGDFDRSPFGEAKYPGELIFVARKAT